MLKKASKIFQSKDKNVKSENKFIHLELPIIYSELYFYGRITRQESEDILRVNGMHDGQYLLRESITPLGNFTVSMVQNKE